MHKQTWIAAFALCWLPWVAACQEAAPVAGNSAETRPQGSATTGEGENSATGGSAPVSAQPEGNATLVGKTPGTGPSSAGAEQSPGEDPASANPASAHPAGALPADAVPTELGTPGTGPQNGGASATGESGSNPSAENGNSAAAAAAAEGAPPARSNRLSQETSPYLLMHAHNPVDWYPWGPAALEKAKNENKLIFLSIGYSSCYWCHVMERESFMNEEIAKFMNEHFVCIKVDREERPDVDEVYMTSLQVYLQLANSGGSGGWPLSMFLTPDAKPIAGGTYMPPGDSDGRTGFLTALKRVHTAWTDSRDDLLRVSDEMAAFVKQALERKAISLQVALDHEPVTLLLEELIGEFDPLWGGFGYSELENRRPKFPEASNLNFLLSQVRLGEQSSLPEAQRARCQSMLLKTLEQVAAGGIYDQLAGGFHRYSTDRQWQIPHFEKMLYDQAQLLPLYAEVGVREGREDFQQIAKQTAAFIARELTSPEGGFYSALDAETAGQEGAYYVWDKAELESLLTAGEFKLICALYGVGGEANFEGKYALVVAGSLDEAAQALGQTAEDATAALATAREKLLAARQSRERPKTDDKILTGWNGLMIAGLARAGKLLEDPTMIAQAQRACACVLAHARTPQGELLRSYAQGEARHEAFLEDYAYLIHGLLALHQATGDAAYLAQAKELQAIQQARFWDAASGGYFFTSSEHDALFARSKMPADSAYPSGNAITVGNLMAFAKAGEMEIPTAPLPPSGPQPQPQPEDASAEGEATEKLPPETNPWALADKTVRAQLALILQNPTALPRMIQAMDEMLHTRPQAEGQSE